MARSSNSANNLPINRVETPFAHGKSTPLPASLWAAVSPTTADFPKLTENARCDVGIIGAGFSGLSAALHLATVGKTATVVEAAQVGWGASGRNNGLVTAGLKRDPADVLSVIGADAGERLVKFSGEAAGFLFDLIATHDIQCDASNRGWIQVAHSRRAARTIGRRCADWQRRGADVDMLISSDLEQTLGTNYYHEGWIDRRGGSLNPLAYARGLARAASAAGAAIHCESPVLSIDRSGTDFQLRTPIGTVQCPQVLICTNAYGRLPQVHGSVAALRTAQVATRPLDANMLAAILPGHESVSDTRRLLTSFRITADRRLIMGGAGATAGDHSTSLVRHLHEAASDRFGHLGKLDWEYDWSGYLALTPNHLPQIGRIEDGVYAPVACNGRGIAMTSATGKVLADLCCGEAIAECPLPIVSPQRFPGHALLRPGVAVSVHIKRLLDRISRRI